MKKQITILAILLLFAAVYSCKRDKTTEDPPAQTDNYTSTANFFAVNATPMQTYTFDAATGGVFTTAKGTVITVPANAFKTQTGGAVTGNVTIQFKDVYKKSDMVLNNLTTHCRNVGPMKSAGMFYIKAMQGANVVGMAPSKNITVAMPVNGVPIDAQMLPFVLKTDTVPPVWDFSPVDSVVIPVDTGDWLSTSYMYHFYNNSTNNLGNWNNNDNATYFSAYSKTNITLNPLDNITDFGTQLYLVFTGVNSIIYMHYLAPNFPYNYAPIGLPCTAVAVGVKDGKLYSSFTPITISSNLTVNFSLSETTTDEFKTQLLALL